MPNEENIQIFELNTRRVFFVLLLQNISSDRRSTAHSTHLFCDIINIEMNSPHESDK